MNGGLGKRLMTMSMLSGFALRLESKRTSSSCSELCKAPKIAESNCLRITINLPTNTNLGSFDFLFWDEEAREGSEVGGEWGWRVAVVVVGGKRLES